MKSLVTIAVVSVVLAASASAMPGTHWTKTFWEQQGQKAR